MVKGPVPGSKGSYVRIFDSVKRKNGSELPFPAALIGKEMKTTEISSAETTVASVPAEDAIVEEDKT